MARRIKKSQNLAKLPPKSSPDGVRDDLSAEEYYELLYHKIGSLYPEGISEDRCHAATCNFIGFGKLLLEMKRQKRLDDEDDE